MLKEKTIIIGVLALFAVLLGILLSGKMPMVNPVMTHELNKVGKNLNKQLQQANTAEEEITALSAIWDWGYPDEEGIKTCPSSLSVSIKDKDGNSTSDIMDMQDPVQADIYIECNKLLFWYYEFDHYQPIDKESLLILMNE